MSKLYFEYGPMGSQKTTKLLTAAYNYEENGGRRVLVTKPDKDTKGELTIEARLGASREVDFLTTPEMDVEAEVVRRNLAMVREGNKGVNALLVDEAQFLQPEQVDQLFNLAVLRHIPVLAFGLRTDFLTNSFPGSRRLMEIAHTIRESIAMCAADCENKAMFNARQVNGVYVTEGEQVAIDGEGENTYSALCGECYMKLVRPLAGAASKAVTLETRQALSV